MTKNCLQQTMCFGQQSLSFRQFQVVYIVVVIATAGVRCHVVVVSVVAVTTTSSVVTIITIVITIVIADGPVAACHIHMHKSQHV